MMLVRAGFEYFQSSAWLQLCPADIPARHTDRTETTAADEMPCLCTITARLSDAALSEDS